jgi:hypothetical protein
LAKLTLVFAALLIVLGLVGFLGSGSVHPTALIPAYFGLALAVFGFLAISPNESRRKLFMHVNVTIGLLGFLGGAIEGIKGLCHTAASSAVPNALISAEAAKLTMAGLMLLYVILYFVCTLLHRRAAFGKGLVHERDARRQRHEQSLQQRGTVSAWAQRPDGQG